MRVSFRPDFDKHVECPPRTKSESYENVSKRQFCAEQKADHNSPDMELTGRNVRNNVNNVD